MIKKIAAMTVAFFAVAGIGYALNMEISAEMKTGLIWDDGRPVEVGIHHNDYAGPQLGRLRLEMHLWAANLGIRLRFQQQTWGEDETPQFHFAYAYGNFLNEQLRVSIGSLSNSPWRAGGPTIWQGLDHQVGIRTEIMPRMIPGLNFGFTLNYWDYMRYFTARETLGGLLMESVIGVAYSNRHFYGRFGWRLDSDADVDNEPQEGHSLMYRLEPLFISNFVPDLRMWINGWWRGIGPRYIGNDPLPVPDSQTVRENWFYAIFTPGGLHAELRLGAEFTGVDSHQLVVRPFLGYWIHPSVRVGTFISYQYNFGAEATVTNVPFRIMFFQPEVRFQFGPAYLAFVYRFEMEHNTERERLDRHWLNLRAVIAF